MAMGRFRMHMACCGGTQTRARVIWKRSKAHGVTLVLDACAPIGAKPPALQLAMHPDASGRGELARSKRASALNFSLAALASPVATEAAWSKLSIS